MLDVAIESLISQLERMTIHAKLDLKYTILGKSDNNQLVVVIRNGAISIVGSWALLVAVMLYTIFFY